MLQYEMIDNQKEEWVVFVHGMGGSSLHITGLAKGAVILADKIKRYVPYKFLYRFFAWFMMPKKPS